MVNHKTKHRSNKYNVNKDCQQSVENNQFKVNHNTSNKLKENKFSTKAKENETGKKNLIQEIIQNEVAYDEDSDYGEVEEVAESEEEMCEETDLMPNLLNPNEQSKETEQEYFTDQIPNQDGSQMTANEAYKSNDYSPAESSDDFGMEDEQQMEGADDTAGHLKQFCCHICNKMTRSQRSLTAHLAIVHFNIPLLQIYVKNKVECRVCFKQIQKQKSLLKHLALKHNALATFMKPSVKIDKQVPSKNVTQSFPINQANPVHVENKDTSLEHEDSDDSRYQNANISKHLPGFHESYNKVDESVSLEGSYYSTETSDDATGSFNEEPESSALICDADPIICRIDDDPPARRSNNYTSTDTSTDYYSTGNSSQSFEEETAFIINPYQNDQLNGKKKKVRFSQKMTSPYQQQQQHVYQQQDQGQVNSNPKSSNSRKGVVISCPTCNGRTSGFAKRKTRCKQCSACLTPSCGNCKFCLNPRMKKSCMFKECQFPIWPRCKCV